MKKQLLIAAVAASMTSVAMADISISGSSKVNAVGGEYSMEADMTITGKSGDTSVVAALGLDGDNSASNIVEQLYATSSIAGVSVKVGTWKSGKGELGKNVAGDTRISASTSFGGINLNYEDRNATGGTSTKISGEIAGVALSYKAKAGNTSETTASGSMGGVSASFHTKDNAAAADQTSVTLSTEVQGVTLTYVDIDAVGNATASDGFFGANDAITKATGLALSTTVAGNKVTFKSLEINGGDVDKLIVTRALASGATFEATYVDKAAGDSLDLELAVSF
jgi:hypothetical protein